MIRIVIVGGGFCGSSIAASLEKEKNFSVTLIDKKPYFEYSPGIIKLISEPQFHRRIKKPYTEFLRNTTILADSVTAITPETVETNKETHSYDFLVIATGIDYPVFLKNKTNVYTVKSGDVVKNLHSRIISAHKILIVGGGLIGTEAAGEIVTAYPEKELVLVHSADRLIERNPLAASHYARNFLEEHGVKILCNQRVTTHKENRYITENDQQISADVALWCAGIDHNPSFMKGFSDKIFSDNQALKVNRFLQLQGYDNIFVGGDITGVTEEKTAQNADRHALLISSNLNRTIHNQSLMPYKPYTIPLVISLGRVDGLFAYPPLAVPGFIPAFLKWAIEKVSLYRL